MRRKEMTDGDLVYRSAKGIIRLARKFMSVFNDTVHYGIWEISYTDENNKKIIERFKTKEEAEKRIEELLKETPSQTYPLPIEARDGDNL